MDKELFDRMQEASHCSSIELQPSISGSSLCCNDIKASKMPDNMKQVCNGNSHNCFGHRIKVWFHSFRPTTYTSSKMGSSDWVLVYHYRHNDGNDDVLPDAKGVAELTRKMLDELLRARKYMSNVDTKTRLTRPRTRPSRVS